MAAAIIMWPRPQTQQQNINRDGNLQLVTSNGGWCLLTLNLMAVAGGMIQFIGANKYLHWSTLHTRVENVLSLLL